MSSERDKMLAGALYDPYDAQLVAERSRARRLFRAFNETRDDQPDERARLLAELIPASGREVWIEPPFYCDYGHNITLGDKVLFNFNCTILDLAPVVRIGAQTVIGAGSVVARDIPERVFAAGNPCRVIRAIGE